MSFCAGVKKQAGWLPRTLGMAKRLATSKPAIAGALAGAVGGGVAGAANAEEGSGFGGALKGALIGGLSGGAAGVAARKGLAAKRLGSYKDVKNKAWAASQGIPTAAK